MMKEYDVVIIGGGPGGYVAAIRGSQLGMHVALIEKDKLGGICLNWGCIPTKSLLRNAEIINLLHKGNKFGFSFDNKSLNISYASAQKRSRQISNRFAVNVENLLKKKGVDIFSGNARLKAKNQVIIEPEGKVLDAKYVVIATGSRPNSIPGIKFDGRIILNWRHALELKQLPGKMIIVGAGAIGVEFAYLWRSYGVDVTIVEMLPTLLPWADADISKELRRNFHRQRIRVITGAQVKKIKSEKKGLKLTLNSREKTEELDAQKALISVGIKPNSQNLGLEELGVIRENGYIQIDDEMQTNVPGIFAVGDVTGKIPLAHVASVQGIVAIDVIAGRAPRPLKYQNMPRCCYCNPEVASIGITENYARATGYEIKIGNFPLSANGKALGMGEEHGFVKIIADNVTHELLGVHLIGSQVTELLGALTGMIALESTAEELAYTVFPHPSLSEAIKEAAQCALGEPLHL